MLSDRQSQVTAFLKPPVTRRWKEYIMSVLTSTALCENPLIGYVPMPADFPYIDILRKGRPRHDPMSRFRLRHPEMPCSRRAKIFAPFDALRGFNEAVASREILYTDKPELGENEKEDLDRKLALLSRLTFNRQAARKNTPVLSVTYFLPCPDEYHDAYGTGGTIETITGICSRVDVQVTRTITIGEHNIPLDDVTGITLFPVGRI